MFAVGIYTQKQLFIQPGKWGIMPNLSATSEIIRQVLLGNTLIFNML